MDDYDRSLNQLCECFRGEFPRHPDWVRLVGLANRTLTTPGLREFALRFEGRIPEDLSQCISEIHRRNLERNDRLTAQLAEAVAAMNDAGIVPVLLKGAATLATNGRLHCGSKLMSDLDIMVEPTQVIASVKALQGTGYRVVLETPPNATRWHADLMRRGDVGAIDLQGQLPGPAFFYPGEREFRKHCCPVAIGEGTALVPCATYQALILIIHDEFQDSGYWVGNIDLRHLLDLRHLVRTGGIDWQMLSSLASSRLARNALETQMVALFSMLGTDVPASFRRRWMPRLQHWRRMCQARFPFLRLPLILFVLLDYKNYASGPGVALGQATGFGRLRVPPSSRLRFLLALSGTQRAGKI
jgi:hypothetical protein